MADSNDDDPLNPGQRGLEKSWARYEKASARYEAYTDEVIDDLLAERNRQKAKLSEEKAKLSEQRGHLAELDARVKQLEAICRKHGIPLPPLDE